MVSLCTFRYFSPSDDHVISRVIYSHRSHYSEDWVLLLPIDPSYGSSRFFWSCFTHYIETHDESNSRRIAQIGLDIKSSLGLVLVWVFNNLTLLHKHYFLDQTSPMGSQSLFLGNP